eukprot:1724967-Pleurochrysis_carterae.AAC.1
MLSPIREIGERPEPSSAEKRGTRSAGKQPLSVAEGHTPSTTERHESDTTERRWTRSVEKRVPSIVEEHAPDTTDKLKSSPPEDTLPTSTARIASSKSAKAAREQAASSSSRAPSADAENATPAIGKAAAPATSDTCRGHTGTRQGSAAHEEEDRRTHPSAAHSSDTRW